MSTQHRSTQCDTEHQEVKVHFCCGPFVRKGWINVDCIDFGQEVIADLQEPWHFLDSNSVDHIYCKDGLEHQDSVEHFLREAARVLRPGGTLEIWVPHFKNPSAYRVTHRHWFSWSYFDVYPEPHDAVQNLEVILNRIYIGRKDSAMWAPIHWLANLFPKWWERILYVSNVQVVFRKTV